MGRVDDYLEALADRLRLTPDSARRLLEETEAHLEDVIAEEEAAGAGRDLAEQRALARFGSAREVADAANGGRWRLVGPSIHAAAGLVAVGCLVVVAGTLLAEALSWATSTAWVFGRPADLTPTAAQIAHWMQVQPGAHSWQQAAASENRSDALLLRGLAGAIGFLLAIGVRRLSRGQARVGGAVAPAIGLTAFAGAAVLLLTGSLRTLDWGRGQMCCDATVALLVALAYAVACSRGALLTSSRPPTSD